LAWTKVTALPERQNSVVAQPLFYKSQCHLSTQQSHCKHANNYVVFRTLQPNKITKL